MVRIIMGIIGILFSLFPGPNPFLIPGLIVVVHEVPFLRKYVAWGIRILRKMYIKTNFYYQDGTVHFVKNGIKIYFMKEIMMKTRKIVYARTGIRFYFKKGKRIRPKK